MRKEEREEKMVLLDVKIKELLQKVEEAGEKGRVQEAADLQSQVDKLQEELTQFKEVRLIIWILFFLITHITLLERWWFKQGRKAYGGMRCVWRFFGNKWFFR